MLQYVCMALCVALAAASGGGFPTTLPAFAPAYGTGFGPALNSGYGLGPASNVILSSTGYATPFAFNSVGFNTGLKGGRALVASYAPRATVIASPAIYQQTPTYIASAPIMSAPFFAANTGLKGGLLSNTGMY